jgi:hypothetical protein
MTVAPPKIAGPGRGLEELRAHVDARALPRYLFYAAALAGTQVTGMAVYVTSTGQLGVLTSSERFKTAVASMGSTTERLMQLRPVSFHFKSEPEGGVQYGLIADEVAKVYPELVIRDEAGSVKGVRYEELTPILLKQAQQQGSRLRQQEARLEQQGRQLQSLQARLARLMQRNQSREVGQDAGSPGAPGRLESDAKGARAADALLEVREESRRGRRGGEAKAARRAEESALASIADQRLERLRWAWIEGRRHLEGAPRCPPGKKLALLKLLVVAVAARSW